MLVDKIILGTVQLGMDYGINNKMGRPSVQEAHKILDTAYEAGIHAIDTAEAYGNSQEVVGSYILNNPNKNFKIYTKFKTSEAFDLRKQLTDTLKSLSQSSIETYSFHRITDIHNLTLRDELIHLKERQLISKIGVSVYSNEELIEVSDLDFIDVIQLPFNLLDNWSKRGEAISYAKKKNKIIQVRSVFLQGLFYMDDLSLPVKLNGLRQNIAEIKAICREHNIDINTLALNYALSFQEIDQVLIGVENCNQMNANIAALKSSVSKHIFEDISKIDVENESLLDPRTWS